MWPPDKDTREGLIEDEISGNDDKLISQDCDYDDYFGDLERLIYERADGTRYLVTIGIDYVDQRYIHWEEELEVAAV